jgi:hypothetical protein
MKHVSLLAFAVALSCVSSGADSQARDPRLQRIVDVPGLPRVLLLGDSISIGYTLPVREALRGKANVHRPAVNCSSSGYALTQMESWLGEGRWDVIHFNFGLHDAKLPPEGIRHSELAVYEVNLRKIVRRLKTTGARLVWATTTPVPMGGNLAPNRRFGNIDAYNHVAKRVMSEERVPLDDLNRAIAPHTEKVGRPQDVHFTEAGYAILADSVVAAINPLLPSIVDLPREQAAQKSHAAGR